MSIERRDNSNRRVVFRNPLLPSPSGFVRLNRASDRRTWAPARTNIAIIPTGNLAPTSLLNLFDAATPAPIAPAAPVPATRTAARTGYSSDDDTALRLDFDDSDTETDSEFAFGA